MTTTNETTLRIGKPEDFGLDPALVDARIREADRNRDYFMAHANDLFDRYPDQWLLIYSGGEVEPFDDLAKLIEARSRLDDSVRGGSIIERRRTGAWIL